MISAMIGIPQGIAYGLLAGVGPQYGLYTVLFSSTFYGLLATSRHSSVGPTASMEILVGEVVESNFENLTGKYDN